MGNAVTTPFARYQRLAESRLVVRPKTYKISHAIVDSIKDRILRGELVEGSTLPPINKLSQQLSVSQGTLREALRILEDDGFLIMKPGPRGGPVVCHPGAEKATEVVAEILQLKKMKLRDLHEVRYYLELPCVRIAAKERTEEALGRLKDSIRASREATDNAEFLRQTVTFHAIIADCSQNRILSVFFACLRDLVYTSFLRVNFDAERRAIENDEHEQIYEAIRTQDQDLAEHWMREHLDGFSSILSEWFELHLEKLF